MSGLGISDKFDSYYYEHDCGLSYERNEHWLNFFGAIATRVVNDFSLRTMLDAGCAKGFLVECLRERGVEAFGVDISEHAISCVFEPFKEYCKVASIAEPVDTFYDLIISIEVVEHMEPLTSEAAIENLCTHTDKILFSSSPYDYSEVTHINVRQPEVWAQMFARNGFFRDLDYDASYITPWAVLFCRDSRRLEKLVFEYERKLWLTSKENFELRKKNLELDDQLRQLNLGGHLSIKDAHTETGDSLDSAHKRIAELELSLKEITDSEDWQLMQEIKRIRNNAS